MNKGFNRLFTNPNYFRWLFFILMLIGIVFNGFLLESENNFYILYIFSSIFLGIGFYNLSTWSIVFLTALVVICRFFLLPETSHDLVAFLAYLFTYLSITFISVGLMKSAQKIREDNLELTIALSNALDSRDTYTKHHSENVARYAVEIAEKMKLPKEMCNVIHIGGLLHDIGKIGIPEHILSKSENLTDGEYDIIRTHPAIGYEIIKHIKAFKDSGILDIVLYHHERYDGTGYPTGLKGNNIPLAARIIAVADAFDAMSSKRVYRNELKLESILNEIRKNKRSQFDPQIVDIFLSLFEHNKEWSGKNNHELMNNINVKNASG
jgi:putative nucleotidyltransferase with HDIG domain